MANRIITINRMYGSNGRKLGKALAKELGIHYYDRELIQIASEKKREFHTKNFSKSMKNAQVSGVTH